jgi:hypothetical protein
MLDQSQYCAFDCQRSTPFFHFRVCTQIVDIMFDIMFSSFLNAIKEEIE